MNQAVSVRFRTNFHRVAKTATESLLVRKTLKKSCLEKSSGPVEYPDMIRVEFFYQWMGFKSSFLAPTLRALAYGALNGWSLEWIPFINNNHTMTILSIPSPSSRRACLATAALSIAVPVPGSVIVQTFLLDDIFNDYVEYRPEQPPEPGAGFLNPLAITTLEKFNPALGTLNQIVFRLEIDFSFLAGVELIERQDDFFSMDVLFLAPAEAGLFYSQAPFLHALALLELDMDISFSVGLSGEPDSFYLFPSEFSNSDTGDITFADTMLASFYNAPDFIGTGFVENLILGIGMPSAADVFSVTGDADNIRLFYGFEIASSTVLTMEYHYTPIPEPRAAGLFAGLLVGCAVLGRRRLRG